MRACFLTFILFSRLGFASIGFIDVSTQSSEIRFAGFVVPTLEGAVTLRVCIDPLKGWKTRCAQNALQSGALTMDEWKSRVRSYLHLDGNLKDDRTLEREQSIRWMRERVREKLENGSLDSSSKEHAENMLNEMMDAVDPEKVAQEKELKLGVFQDWEGWLSESSETKVQSTVLQSTEPLSYQVALAPFATWIHQSLCRCEKVAGNQPLDKTQCVLKKGDQVLAHADAALSDCESRASCQSLSWISVDAQTAQESFVPLVARHCGGFFTAGAIVTGLSPGEAKVVGNGFSPIKEKEK